jgi:hypothetical protein
VDRLRLFIAIDFKNANPAKVTRDPASRLCRRDANAPAGVEKPFSGLIVSGLARIRSRLRDFIIVVKLFFSSSCDSPACNAGTP